MLRVGITGGIGSGKTTACKIFEELNVPVYYADERARWLMDHNEFLRSSLIGLFGEGVYGNDHKLNRPYLADIVFTHPEKLHKLNELVHPAVREDRLIFSEQHIHKPYMLTEAALLIESGSYKEMDKMILVYAPEEVRIARVIERDQTTESKVRDRIRNQMSDEEKIPFCQYVIHNFGAFSLREQVCMLHDLILKK